MAAPEFADAARTGRQLAGVVERLRSPFDGEGAAVALIATRHHKALGMSWTDVADTALLLGGNARDPVPHILPSRPARRQAPKQPKAARSRTPRARPVPPDTAAMPEGEASAPDRLREVMADASRRLGLSLDADGGTHRGLCPICGGPFALRPSDRVLLVNCACADPALARLSIWRGITVIVVPYAAEVAS